ncbi:3994_t:CDS:10 [Rhizophagus irregularis]|nr:3994_t:CDS:10 [Rhizophagus irregularis]
METVEPTRQYETDPTSHGLLSPLSPQSPQTPPMSPPSPYQESNRRVNNPLIDLIETEKKYLKDLKCLLQQVTACWSNDDFPPPELDLMFRNVEVIYKQNKKFYLKLDKIGSNPASAKDLGETLLIWIDDMDDPYTKYVENFKLGFDSIPEIEENLNLQQTLNDISVEKNQPVSLDYFFDMPLKRLYYYKKLYLRLYRSTEPGRADNSLLLAANERIDPAEDVVSSTVISSVSEDVSSVMVSPTIEVHQIEKQDNIAPSIKSQTIDSPVDPNIVVSTDKVQSVKRDWTLEELESQLDTSKTKDLFTKLPKIVKISLLSKNLPFERKIVLHGDFIIETTKSMNSTETTHINAHIFLLTDLLLICQEITQEEKDLKLMYPPFNTYHLAINDVSDDQEDSLELTILQKEMIILYANDKDTKDDWLREINKAIEFSSNVESNPRLSTISTLSMSSDALKRSPSVGNLINRASMRPVSSISQGSNLFPDFSSTDSPITRSRTPDPPQNAGGQYPGDYLPSGQGRGQERHNSDPISSPGIRNKLTVGLQVERANSMASLVSVMSIASFKETIFRSSACEVFVWINSEWRPLTKKDKCIVEVRLTVQNKGCWAILLESSNRMVLNAWVHSATTLHREDENSVSISCEIGQRKEYYKINTTDSAESDQFINYLLKIKESAKELNVPAEGYISRSSSLQTIEPLREVEKTVTQVMEVKCRVFLQNDHGVWTNIGWGNMKLSLETPSHRKRIIVNSDKKTKTIIDAIISEDGVEKVGKSVALTLNNTGSNLRIVYLLKMKDEESAAKVIDIMKEKRKK